MGYYTFYQLQVLNPVNEEHEDTIREDFEQQFPNESKCVDQVDMKWYSHDDDMIEFSKRHPGVIFELLGTGEETYDEWVCRYRDGKSECLAPEVIWPIFEEILLEERVDEQTKKPADGNVQEQAGEHSSESPEGS